LRFLINIMLITNSSPVSSQYLINEGAFKGVNLQKKKTKYEYHKIFFFYFPYWFKCIFDSL